MGELGKAVRLVPTVYGDYCRGYDVFGHRMMKICHPVRSGLNRHHIAWLGLQWVTMLES